jgi:hypothetical protein
MSRFRILMGTIAIICLLPGANAVIARLLGPGTRTYLFAYFGVRLLFIILFVWAAVEIVRLESVAMRRFRILMGRMAVFFLLNWVIVLSIPYFARFLRPECYWAVKSGAYKCILLDSYDQIARTYFDLALRVPFIILFVWAVVEIIRRFVMRPFRILMGTMVVICLLPLAIGIGIAFIAKLLGPDYAQTLTLTSNLSAYLFVYLALPLLFIILCFWAAAEIVRAIRNFLHKSVDFQTNHEVG